MIKTCAKTLMMVLLASATATGCGGSPGGGDDEGADARPGDPNAPDARPDDPNPDEPCTTSKLFAGNPLYDGDEWWDETGVSQLEDPPLYYRTFEFDGNTVYTHTGYQIWYGDFTAPELEMKKLLGSSHEGNSGFVMGACAQAQLADTTGIAVLPDHSLIVTDAIGNAVVKITDPLGPNCTVVSLAGTNEELIPVPGSSPYEGDEIDGPGATAKFGGMAWPQVDAAGNIYVLDVSFNKIRKIANDAAHTVSTLIDLDDRGGRQMIQVNGKLYLTATDNGEAGIIEVDPATGTKRDIAWGDAEHWEPLNPGGSAVIDAITFDGAAFYVAGMGYIWRVTMDGDVTHAGGGTRPLDFPPTGYDVYAEHPARETSLDIHAGVWGVPQALAYRDGALYWAGHAGGHAAWIQKFECPN